MTSGALSTGAVPFLDADAVTRGTPMPALIERLRSAFAHGRYQAPPRLAATMGNAESLLVMPAWSDDRIGTKIVTVDPDRRPSVASNYVLADRASGRPIALLDGAALTRRRTAAASALAASLLARPASRSLLMLGTGALIAPLIEAYASVFALERIRIWGRDAAKAERRGDEARALGYPAEHASNIADALADSDIVSSATLATAPLIRGDDIAAGTHVDLIGAFTPDMAEADPHAFARARVFVDTHDGAAHEAGDLIQAIAAGAIGADAILGDLAALCSGRVVGRDDARAITLFKSVGTAIEDLVAAELICRAAEIA